MKKVLNVTIVTAITASQLLPGGMTTVHTLAMAVSTAVVTVMVMATVAVMVLHQATWTVNSP